MTQLSVSEVAFRQFEQHQATMRARMYEILRRELTPHLFEEGGPLYVYPTGLDALADIVQDALVNPDERIGIVLHPEFVEPKYGP